jgi:hypothetical protein
VAEGSPAVKASGFPSLWRSPAVLPAIILVLTGLFIASEAVVGLAIVLLEGVVSLGVLAASTFAGMWIVPLLGLGKESWRDRLMVGAGLGIGLLSLLVLAVGTVGWLRPGVMVLTACLAAAGLLRIGPDVRRALERNEGKRNEEAGRTGVSSFLDSSIPPSSSGDAHAAEQFRREALALEPFHYLWLLVTPFLALALLAATLPPGILWQEEAWGYDVLEYHLAVPKEFHEAGRIFFMPYNVYSNFPLNSEMLSLSMMSLRGDPVEAAFAAQLVNVGLAMLFVAAAWWAGRLYSRRAGVVAGVLAATTPWIAYLAGVAYVEPGMLAMGMLAVGAMLRATQSETNAARWALAAGLLAGFACGYKYTAIPLIAIPLAAVPLFAKTPWPNHLKQMALFAVGLVVAFSPWMIRNLLNTGNPVFPLAYSIFGAQSGVWDDELEARWQRGHGWAGAALDSGESIVITALDRTVLDTRLGLMLAVLALAGIAFRRDRGTIALLAILALQITIWFTATHLFARFAAVMLIPLLVLAGRVAQDLRSLKAIILVVLAVVVGAGWNLYHLGGLYYIHTRTGLQATPMRAHGHSNWFVTGEWPGLDYLKIVNALEDHPRVMFVGEARTFYVQSPREYAVVFNHHPLAQAVERILAPAEPGGSAPARSAATSPSTGDARTGLPVKDPDYRAIIRWLKNRGVTHLLVHWMEMERLRNTYGFETALHPQLFIELEAAGLSRMGDFMLDDDGIIYATLYEVPDE